jgi:hypothetical protein
MKKPRSLKSMIMSAIGKVWMYYPPRLAVKRRCKNPNRPGWFKCEKGGCDIQKVEVDHVIPCILPEEGFKGWDRYFESKFVTEDKLMGLCHEHHLEKSKEENARRRAERKKK